MGHTYCCCRHFSPVTSGLSDRMALVLVVAVAVLTHVQPTARAQKAALLIIDVQECFMPGGSLPVPEGDQVIPVINRLREEMGDRFSMVVVSQDWHCPDHVSFASQHPGKPLFSIITLTYNHHGQLCHGEHVPGNFPHAVDCSKDAMSDRRQVSQTLWPDHCIINVTSGATSAKVSPLLTVKDSDIIVRKGYSCGIDSYSAFYDNGGFQQTELDQVLRQHGIELLVVTGLALDYCAYYTAKDANALGYRVLMVEDACRGVAPDSTAAAVKDLKDAGVEVIQSAHLKAALQGSKQANEPSEPGEPYGVSFILMAVAGALFTALFALRTRM